MDKLPYYQIVANQIIEQLKKGTAPWLIPWEEGCSGGVMPMNPVSKTRYKGINAIYLMAQGAADNRWLTYKQAQSLGAQIKKGEKGTTIQYWKFIEERLLRDELNNPLLDKTGLPLKVTSKLERPRVFYATVFNASQIDGMPPRDHNEQPWMQLDNAESILRQSGAIILHSETARAYYKKSTDSIHLPAKNQFKSAACYYATALHELSHWTGHSSRLNRDLSHPFGSEGYAREELRAEIASLMFNDKLGLGHDPSQHAAYIKSWISVLEEDPLELFRASSDAEKIMTYLDGLTLNQRHETQLELDQQLKDEPSIENKSMSAFVPPDERIWLTIPYHQKETVKELVGKSSDGLSLISWDKDVKKWYAHPSTNLDLVRPWLETSQAQEKLVTEKTWLAIPYTQKETAKAIIGQLADGTPGIAWDKNQQCWYAKPGTSLNRIKPWLAGAMRSSSKPANDPITEFKGALMSVGCLVTGEHPLMDGKLHRISVEGDRASEKAGFYVGHLDGLPAGYIKNYRTGVELKWKLKGYLLTVEEKAKLKATAFEKLKKREEELAELQFQTAQRLRKKLSEMQPITHQTPYLASKGIESHLGIYTNNEQKITCIPAIDTEGDLWSIQYIAEDGTKRFAKNSRKSGCFHVIGGLENLAKTPVIVISEGYATASTLSEALKIPVVSAFDAGNLKPVAKALQEKFPQIPILIAGDDDHFIEQHKGENPGKEKAKEAAVSVNGLVVFPIFAPGEQKDNPEQFSDFNDLAQKSRLGFEAVIRQVKSSIILLDKREQQNSQYLQPINQRVSS